MPKYKVGDQVWYAKCWPELVEKTCPTCFGKKKVTLILGNGDQVVLPCGGCAPGCISPRGFVQEYEYVVAPELVTITKVISEIGEEGEETYYYSPNGGHYGKNLFTTKEEAQIRAEVMKREADEAQITQAKRIKEKVHKSFSWNAHYHNFPNCPLLTHFNSANKDREKYLVEALGGCWHEWETREKYLYRCKKCHLLCAATTLENCRQINLSTWEGFGWLWERAKKKEWWNTFVILRCATYTSNQSYESVWCFLPFIDPIRFAEALYEFLKERET